MRNIKENEVMYLYDVKVIVKYVNITQDTWCGLPEDDKGIGLKYDNANNSLWIPHTMENLLSYTPYTLEDGVMEGYSYEKPYQPIEGELVLVSDDTENWFVKPFKQMEDNKYVVFHISSLSGNMKFHGGSTWKYCKPYNINEIKF